MQKNILSKWSGFARRRLPGFRAKKSASHWIRVDNLEQSLKGMELLLADY